MPPVAAMDAAYDADIREELKKIAQAIGRADAPSLGHHAHRLQGTLQMLGRHAQATLAAQLVELAHDAAPDWAGARRLLDLLQAGQGSRTAGTLQVP